MSKPGPKPFLDEIKRREICAMLTVGASQRAAAEYVGCSPGTITNTAEREPDFARQIERATAECEFNSLQKINAAGDRSWRAAAWILERTRPERYEKVNLRQPTAEQLAGFFDSYSAALLDDLPEQYRYAMAKKLQQLSDRLVDFVRTPGNKEADEFKPLEDLCREQDSVLQFAAKGLGLSHEEIPHVRASLPGSASPLAPAAERRKRHEALERLQAHSIEQWQARRAAMTPDEIASEERRIERRTRAEQNADIAYFREIRAGIAAAQQAGDERDDWDWIAQLKEACFPPEHPAYAEFSLPLEEWAKRREVSGGGERGREAPALRTGAAQNDTVYPEAADKAGAMPPRADEDVARSGKASRIEPVLEDRPTWTDKAGVVPVGVAALAMLVGLLTALLGGLCGPVFQSRPFAVATQSMSCGSQPLSLAAGLVRRGERDRSATPKASRAANGSDGLKSEGAICGDTLLMAGLESPAHVDVRSARVPILEQNPPDVAGEAFKDRGQGIENCKLARA